MDDRLIYVKSADSTIKLVKPLTNVRPYKLIKNNCFRRNAMYIPVVRYYDEISDTIEYGFLIRGINRFGVTHKIKPIKEFSQKKRYCDKLSIVGSFLRSYDEKFDELTDYYYVTSKLARTQLDKLLQYVR